MGEALQVLERKIDKKRLRELVHELNRIEKTLSSIEKEQERIRREIRSVGEQVILEYEEASEKDRATLFELGDILFNMNEKIERGDIIVDAKTYVALQGLLNLVDKAEQLMITYLTNDPGNADYILSYDIYAEPRGKEKVYNPRTGGYDEIEKRRAVIRPTLDDLEDMRENIKTISEAIGRKCGFSIPYKESFTPSEILNDVSNCTHVFAEYLAENPAISKESMIVLEEDTPKVMVAKDNYNKTLLEMLAIWRTAVMKNKEIYYSPDFKELKGYIIGDNLYLRVGSSTSHATNIYISNDKLHLHYYDTDVDVSETIVSMIEKNAPCKCKVTNDGAKCTCDITRETVENVPVALSLATSMDIRFHDGGTPRDEIILFDETRKYIIEHREEINKEINKWVNKLG